MKVVRLALPLAIALAAAALPACAVDAEEAATTELAATDPAAPPYPIVLAHGFFGFEDFAGIDFINYFHGVKEHLAARGEARVFTPTVDPFNDSIHRGKQLQARVEEIVRRTGARKVNIIGHSQGGLDARYVAHERPDLVASVVTFATPHHGTPLSDHFELIDNPFTSWAFDGFVRILGAPLWDQIGRDTSIVQSFRQFSSTNIARFNRDYPNVPGIPYWSVTGRTASSLGGDACKTNDAPPWIAKWNDTRDTTEVLLKVPQLLLSGWSGAPNDGLVLVESARWGTFLGCVPADHFDEIGQLFGGPAGAGNRWSHLDFYADLVTFLRDRGL
ncbi:MAG: alpha/beta fold hydrolase [Labilithrix sp.]|nr:alpha/beta fold hydrolase [Labilithrix sp.]MCW5812459.1 alpha/beta fold hydrolase [Labilithrix sp.]